MLASTKSARWDWWRVLVAWFFPSLGGFLYGYDIGAMAEVLPALSSSDVSGTSWWREVQASALVQGLITSMVTLGATLGSVAVFYYEARLGRRGELLLASGLYGIGAIAECVANSVVSLCVARCVYGFGVGLAMHGAPSYIAETAPAKLRGGLVSAKEAMIVVGMLLGYSVGASSRQHEGGWRFVFALAAPLAMLMGVGMGALPRTPRWLALRGRREEAKRALKFLTPTASDEEVETLFPRDDDDDDDEDLGVENEFAGESRGVRPAATCCGMTLSKSSLIADPASQIGLIAGVGLVVLQQVTGQPSVLYYAAQVLEQAGLGTSSAIALAAWKLACTMLAVTSVDAFGRRTLLFMGSAVMAVALGGLAGLALTKPSASSYLTLGSMFLFIGGYQISFGPVTWTIISECFPLAQRGRALAVATITNFSLNALVTFLAAPLLAVSPAACFGTFLILTLYTIYFVNTYVPETRGLTLEQITTMLRERAAAERTPNRVAYGAIRQPESARTL